MTDNQEKKLPDPFDPASLRLDQNFAETAGVKKLLTTVPVRKPNRQDFVRVHPDADFRLTPAARPAAEPPGPTRLTTSGISASAESSHGLFRLMALPGLKD